MEEYNNAKLDKNKRKRINKGKRGASVCYSVNNKRNNDAYAKSKAKQQLVYGLDYEIDIPETENDLIELIDEKRELEKSVVPSSGEE
jgi:endo-alpha-1,4-polygalactosaminidase (GH114 family)